MNIYSDTKKSVVINSIDDWFKYCPPQKGILQWKKNRSAYEMAAFWLSKEKVDAFTTFLPKWFDLTDSIIIPEYESKFDSFGPGRQHDLLINSRNSNCLITIEGKADESFGANRFSEEFKLSIEDKQKNSKSKKLDRMINLYTNIFKDNSLTLNLMYQLTYWFAGSISESKKCNVNKIIMINQVFLSDSIDTNKVEINKVEYNYFISLISQGNFTSINNNEIIGPIVNNFTEGKELYIGKYEEILT